MAMMSCRNWRLSMYIAGRFSVIGGPMATYRRHLANRESRRTEGQLEPPYSCAMVGAVPPASRTHWLPPCRGVRPIAWLLPAEGGDDRVSVPGHHRDVGVAVAARFAEGIGVERVGEGHVSLVGDDLHQVVVGDVFGEDRRYAFFLNRLDQRRDLACRRIPPFG